MLGNVKCTRIFAFVNTLTHTQKILIMDTLTIQSIEALKENGTIATIFYEKNKFGETEVGYSYKNSFVYHWFSEYVWMDGGKTLTFQQSYSIATGVRKKGRRHGCKVEHSLRSKIEKLNK